MESNRRLPEGCFGCLSLSLKVRCLSWRLLKSVVCEGLNALIFPSSLRKGMSTSITSLCLASILTGRSLLSEFIYALRSSRCSDFKRDSVLFITLRSIGGLRPGSGFARLEDAAGGGNLGD